MKLKRKVEIFCSALTVAVCATIGGAALSVSADTYDATGDWTKSASAGSGVSITAAQDGGVHFSEASTGAFDGCFYTAGYYNNAVSVSEPIDMYMDVQSGQVAIVLSGNGWAFNQQGNDQSVLNWNPTVSVVLTHYGEEMQLQRTDDWSTAKKTKLEGYNKITFEITASGTDILFNDETVFSFSSTSSDYTYGTAQITVNRFSADSTLDTVVRSIPVATNSAVTYNNAAGADFKVGYKGVDAATVTGVKYAVNGGTEYTAIAEEAVTVTANGVSVALATAQEAFAQAGVYTVVVETTYGDIYYDVTVTSEEDSSTLWSATDGSTAALKALSDGGVTYKNSPASIGDGTRVYDVVYNGDFSVENDVVIDTVLVSGITSFALTDGKNGTTVLEMGLRKENESEFVHCVNYATSWPKAALNADGYTRLTFVIGETNTEVFANGNSIGEAAVGRSAFASGKVGVKTGYCFYSWAAAIEYSVRVGEAVAVDGEARYVQNAGKGVTFTYSAPFAPVTALTYNGQVMEASNYTLTSSKKGVGTVSLTAAQIDALFTATGSYTLTLQTEMGDVAFTLNVVDTVAIELVKDTFTYDVYAGGDLSVPVYANLDTITAVKNGANVLTADVDYTFDESTEIITIKESCLKTLDKGDNVLTVISENNADGVTITVTVEDHTPPVISGSDAANFDKKAAAQADVIFGFDCFDNAFIQLMGNGIAAENYTFADGSLTLKKEYLATLAANASYPFTAQFTYGAVTLFVEVANTTAPSANVVNKNFNPSSPSDVSFDVEVYESTFVSFTGNGIAAEDYVFESGKLTVKKEFLATLSANTYEFTFASEVGELALTVVIEEKEPPVADTTTAVYDVQNPEDIVFAVTMNGGELLSFTGNGITAENYTFADGSLTVKADYLALLNVDSYTFVFEADNGNVDFTVTVKNDVAPSFDAQSAIAVKYDRVEDKTTDFEVEIYANLGKLLSVSGDTITQDDYVFGATQTAGLSKLTLKADYLSSLGVGDNGKYTLVFDNGTLALELRFDYEVDSDYFYYSNGATVGEGTDGYAKISQTAVQSQFNWGYVAEYSGELSVDKPITVLYKFPQNPDKTWMYTVNISGGSHNYFWDTSKTVFAQFGVDGNAFYQLRAGSYPADEWNYLNVAGLICNPDGVNEFTFDIGETETKIYCNGVLINTSPRKRSDFADGKAYLRFSSTTTYTDSTPYCEYLVKVNGGVTAETKTKQFSLHAPEAVEYALRFDNGQFTGLYLENGTGDLTKLSSYRFLYTEFAKSGVLTLEKEDILNDATLSTAGTYTLVVKSTGGEERIYLAVSDKEELELAENEFIFDQREDDDIVVDVWMNADTFVSVTGNGITENDYTFENGVLTISNAYLKTLAYGAATFTVVSQKNGEGVTLTVRVVDYSDPELSTDNAVYDVQLPADVVIGVDVKAGTFSGVTGNDITVNDYTYDQASGNLTVKQAFLATLGTGRKTFTVTVDIFGTPYELTLTINCTNSKMPEFTNGTALFTVTFDKANPADITVTVNANKGNFLALYGSYIASADYTYDAATGVIVLKQSYMNTLSVGTKNTVNINFDNGKIDLVIEIVETKKASGGCKSTALAQVGGFAVCAIALMGAVAHIKKKGENE